MTLSPQQLRVALRRAGIATSAVDAVWPQWWSSDAESSLSATAELTFTVARRLGLSPQDLLDGEATFVWRDETKYKRLTASTSAEEGALSSFGCAVARVAIAGTTQETARSYSSVAIREAILRDATFVDLPSLLSFAWAVGIPVLQLRLFPLTQKRMHAMSAGVRGRAAILLARDASYIAPVTFTLAHEIGHIMLGHLAGAAAVMDFDAPLESAQPGDDEEVAADRYALELLTGQTQPQVATSTGSFTATELAAAVTKQGPQLGIEPGVLAMCAGHGTKLWDKVYGALKIIPPRQLDVVGYINGIANAQLDWSALPSDSRDYLHVVMGLPSDNV